MAFKFSNPFRSQPKVDKAVLKEAYTFGSTAEAKARANGARLNYGRTRMVQDDMSIIRGINRKIVRMYDAALTTNLNSDMPISQTSSNAEILTSLIGVRSRARTLERNNGYAAGLIRDYMANVGGHDPFRLEMKIGTTDAKGKFTAETMTNQQIMEAWKEAGRPENCTVDGTTSRRELYWTAIASMTRCGAGLFQHCGVLNWPYKPFTHNKYGYALRALEIDRLDQYWQRPKTDNSNEILFGIEMDEYQRPLFYHILSRHPGDVFGYSNYTSQPTYRVPVPAEAIIHLRDIRSRPEQIAGMSRMAPVIRILHQLEQFDIAHITACLTTCCKSIWIKKLWPNTPEFIPDHIQRAEQAASELGGDDGIGNAGWGGGEGQRLVNTTPGEINELEYGQEPVMPDPHFPVESASSFKKDILRQVATGTFAWYNRLAQDMESVNFASGRLGENAARDISMMDQEHVIEILARPHFEMWLKYAILNGVLDLPMSRYQEFCRAAVFHGRRWAYTNPMQDVQADILSVEAGLDSRSHIIGESPRGGDAEEVDREQEADREADKRHNLDFSAADVTKPTISKGAPGQDVPSPFEAEEEGKAPDAHAQPAVGESGNPPNPPKKTARAAAGDDDFSRFEHALETMASTDSEFVESGDYTLSKSFIRLMRRLRNKKPAND